MTPVDLDGWDNTTFRVGDYLSVRLPSAPGYVAVGDPACDLAIAWTLFHGDSRNAFRDRLAVDDETWTRGRGWALWKALITLAEAPRASSADSIGAAVRFGWRVGPREVVDEALGDFEGKD